MPDASHGEDSSCGMMIMYTSCNVGKQIARNYENFWVKKMESEEFTEREILKKLPDGRIGSEACGKKKINGQNYYFIHVKPRILLQLQKIP